MSQEHQSKGDHTTTHTQLDSTQKSDQSIIAAHIAASFFSGPLPHPEILQQYEQILPGSADRILKMAEEQSSHRRRLERCVVMSEQARANRGLWFGFIIGMTTILGGIVLIYFDKQWQGFIIGLSGLATLVGTFIWGQKEKADDLAEKEGVLRERLQGQNE